MSHAQLELLAGLLAGLVTGLVSAWYGYQWVKRRDDKLHAIQMAMEVLGDAMTEKRRAFRKALKAPEVDLKRLACASDAAHEDFHQPVISVLNRYDLICRLRKEKILSKEIFDDYLCRFIRADYTLLESYLREYEIDQIHRGEKISGPFFPMIDEVLGRPES